MAQVGQVPPSERRPSKFRKISLALRPIYYTKVEYYAPVRRILGHKCDLTISEDKIYEKISEGVFVDLRRRFRKWLTVSPQHPATKKYLKSTAKLESEAMHHWNHYYYMIHPFSDARFFWEMFMIPVYLILIILIPMEVSDPFPTILGVTLRILINVICFIDIILYFFTGYFKTKQNKVILDKKKVAKHYIITYFLWDILSTCPIQEVMFWTKNKYIYPFKVFLMLKIVRVHTLIIYLTELSQRTKFCVVHIKLVDFLVWFIVIVMWPASLIELFSNIRKLYSPDPNISETIFGNIIFPMVINGYEVVKVLMGVGVGEKQNIDNWKMFFAVVGLLLGTALNMLILARVMQLFQKQSSTKHKYLSLLDEIGEYMKFKELPTSVRSKVFRYVNFKFQKRIFKEDEILDTISSVLKQDILRHTCQRMIEHVDIFKDLPTHVMLRIVTKLRSEVYLSGDVIVVAGYAGNAMYFIYTGSVAVYTSKGKEICHLEDGTHFGEIALVINEPRVATVVAVKECELFKLNRRDFQEAIEPFPELNERIRQSAMSRLENTLKMDKSLNDVINEGADSLTVHSESVQDIFNKKAA